MPSFIDLTGKRFHRLKAISHRTIQVGKQILVTWLCRCRCGKVVEVLGANLRYKRTKSCGCWKSDHQKLLPNYHGMRKTKIYTAWCRMRQRCDDENDKDYGGRGIKVCRRWRRSFIAFARDVGAPPSKDHQIDRINNSGNYEPGNVKWSTRIEQGSNKRNNFNIEFNGEVLTAAGWARRTGIPYDRIRDRILNLGWTIEKTLTTRPRPIMRQSEKPGSL